MIPFSYKEFSGVLSLTHTDLDDSPLLYDDGVISRRRGAPLLVHKQSLQRSGNWLALNTHTQKVTGKYARISILSCFCHYISQESKFLTLSGSTWSIHNKSLLYWKSEENTEISLWAHVIGLIMTQLLEIGWALPELPCVHEEEECGMEGSCCCLWMDVSVYISIYSRPQRSTDEVDVSYSAEEQEVRFPRSGRQLQI